MSKSNELPSKRQEETVLPKTKAKTTNFTQISNEVLLDQRLSFKARGILALLLSRPKNWKIYIDEVISKSDPDGKHSVRTGFKELKEFGYLELVTVYNKETGRFNGTVYKLCLPELSKGQKSSKKSSKKNLSALKDSQKVEKTEVVKNSISENQPENEPVYHKTPTLNNTNSSNTKHSNTKIQQQQAKVDDDVILKNLENENMFSKENKENHDENLENQTVTNFLPYLQDDENWKKQFVGKNICKQVGTTEILTATKFDLLLKHFTQTSISSGTTYKNVAAIKRHFFNWFNANLKKGALSSYIEQQTVLPKKTRKQVKALMPKTDAILNKIYGQQCENEAHLYRCLQILATHSVVYENALHFLGEEEKTIVNTWLDDIQKVNNLVERGQKAGKLDWFCAKSCKQSKPKARQKSISSKSVNIAITGLSQCFAATQH